MNRGCAMKNPVAGPVEHFSWSVENKDTDKVTYYSPSGQVIERPVPKGLLDEVIKVFDGQPRAIRRSSGGLSVCQPHQIVIYDRTILEPNTLWCPENELQSVVRIKVTFHELLRDAKGQVVSAESILQTKITSAPELRAPFGVEVGNQEITLVDFGYGIVPVSIFHVDKRAIGEPVAYFTEPGVLEGLKASNPGAMALVTVYSLPLKVVRIPDSESSIDIARAQQNHLSLLKREIKLIPDVFKLQTKIPLPTGKSVRYLQSCLTAMLNPNERKAVEPILIGVKTEEEEQLLPFGLFEPN